MLTKNIKYNFTGELTLRKSRVLDAQHQPKDDKVNWLFLNAGHRQFSFIYKIENLLRAEYGKPFKVAVAFTMIEMVTNTIKLNHAYEVLRGEEIIGTIKLISVLE